MATIHHKGNLAPPEVTPDTLLARIEAFLFQCRRPAALEAGEEPVLLLPGQFAFEIRSERLSLELWSENRSLSRRIVAIHHAAPGILDCTIHRFANKEGRLTFLDLDRPQTARRLINGSRQSFGVQFRHMLTRQFPGWKIGTLSTAQDLEHSYSALYPRAHLSLGKQHIAALACPDAAHESGLLAFALIWHQHVRLTAHAEYTTRLALFLPQGSGNQTAHRLRYLDPQRLSFSIYLFNEHGSAGEVDLADLGNLQTRVSCQPLHASSAAAVAAGPPEQWLETVVRASIGLIDPLLLPDPVHSQVLTWAASDRDLIDLLAVTSEGRLCVLELKVTEDPQLPIQALDYWLRIAWHAGRRELDHLFPAVALQTRPPKLILLAPATAFHSSNATILRYFSSQVNVERCGVNSNWREQLRVVLRLEGDSVPVSHRI